MLRQLFTAITLLIYAAMSAQGTYITVTDSSTGEALPQATIRINDNQTIVTNSDGKAYFQQENIKDEAMYTVSYLGYQSISVTMAQLRQSGMAIRLEQVAYELQEVDVQKVTLTADSIMARVKKNVAVNYRSTGNMLKNTMFYRESTVYKPIQASAEMSKSTKVLKANLEKVNADIKKFTRELISHPPQETTEMLAEYMTASKTINGKRIFNAKFIVQNAVSFREDKQSLSPDDVEKKGIRLLMSHLDSTKAYRIKSGLFGTRDTVIGYKEAKKENPNLRSAQMRMTSFTATHNPAYGLSLDFVRDQNVYDYEFVGTVPYGPEEYVYKITFRPRKRKAKYEGTLYISPGDYAVLRAEYDLADGKAKSALNMKFLLGIKVAENISRGTIVYKKGSHGGYYLHYAGSEDGQYVYINRPLKFIEITGGDKEKVAYDLKIEANVFDKKEYLNISREAITEAEFDAVKEKELIYRDLVNYSPAIWDEFTPGNPVTEMERLRKSY